jgi:hypothetical protein
MRPGASRAFLSAEGKESAMVRHKVTKLDWKRELDKKELKYGVLMLLLYLAAIMIATGCSSGSAIQADRAAAETRAKTAAAKVAVLGHVQPTLAVQPLSGRQLTIEKRQHRLETASHFDDDVYGVSFDFPKHYDSREGELPDMDRGLGYLGKIPQEFAAPGGLRLVTIEVPRTAHPGTDFVNAFLTVSVLPNVSESQCSEFSPATEDNDEHVSRKIDGITFHGRRETSAASMHQYSGTYLHGFAEESCYEIGYGIVTAGYGVMDGVKKVNNQSVLQRLEKVVDSITINAPTGDSTQN